MIDEVERKGGQEKEYSFQESGDRSKNPEIRMKRNVQRRKITLFFYSVFQGEKGGRVVQNGQGFQLRPLKLMQFPFLIVLYRKNQSLYDQHMRDNSLKYWK